MQNDSPDSSAAPVLNERYEVSRRLREEPWGEVWLARDRLLGVDVGLKVLPREAPEWTAAQGYYEQEAIQALRLRHPKILGLFHLERTAACLFLVQEAFEGESLLAQFARQQRFTPAQALHLLEQLSQALAFAHQRGVVHQALNPLNILVQGEEVRLSNFAFPREDSAQVHTLELKAYDAPEVIYGDAPTAASNVFSLGVLGFRLVAGSLPYALTFDEPFPYRVEALPADLDEIPLSMQNLLLRCLAVDPEERFPDVAAFLGQLHQVRELKQGGRQSEDYQPWEPQGAGSTLKAVAGRAGAFLGQVWQSSRPVAQKAKDVAVQTGKAFMASPRRQLWGLGLAMLLILLIWLGIRLNRTAPLPEAAKSAPEAVAQLPATTTAGPPRTETAEPPAPPAAPTARSAPGQAPALAPGQPPAAPREAAKPKEERYLVVAATYTDQKQAQALLQKLRKGNFKARIASRTSAGKTQYLVELGPVTGTKAAEDLAKRLKSQEKITARIVKMPTPKSKPAKPAKPAKPSKPSKPAKPGADTVARRPSR